jgi:Fur family peroxide stress response transcriptional regulator
MKNSKKREEILSVLKNGDLLTAQEISERLPNIDRATVYRNIHLFLELGIIREVNLKKGIASYELNKKEDHHQHFICLDCEKVIPIEFDDALISQIIPEGVRIEDYEINLKGKCKDCK